MSVIAVNNSVCIILIYKLHYSKTLSKCKQLEYKSIQYILGKEQKIAVKPQLTFAFIIFY